MVKNFVIILRNPSYGSHLGEHSAAVANLNLQPGGKVNSHTVLTDFNGNICALNKTLKFSALIFSDIICI